MSSWAVLPRPLGVALPVFLLAPGLGGGGALLSSPPQAVDPIVAPCSDDVALRGAVRALRERGEIVVAALDADGAPADRRLVSSDGRWVVAPH